MSGGGDLYGSASILFEVDLNDLGLTYIPSDVGAEAGVRAAPVVIAPDRTVWAVDPGPDRQSWKLIGIDSSGEKLADVDLVELLGLNEPNTFIPCRLFCVGPDRIELLSSRSFDFDTLEQKDYELITINRVHERVARVPLPGLRFDWEAYRVADGCILNALKTETGSIWELTGPGCKAAVLTESSLTRPSMRCGERVIEVLPGDSLRLIWPVGAAVNEPLHWKGERSQGDRGVGGWGDFFGLIEAGVHRSDPTNSDLLLQKRELELLFLDGPKGPVFTVGSCALRTGRLSESDTSSFVVYLDRQSVLDADGNLLELAWGPGSLTLFEYSLRRDEFERRIKQARDR